MRWIGGFEDQILDALKSSNRDIHYQAVCAAGNCELDAAWPHVSGLVKMEQTDKSLLLEAIDAVAAIRPEEAGTILMGLTDSDDQDIVDAAHEAIALAGALSGDDEYDDDGYMQ